MTTMNQLWWNKMRPWVIQTVLILVIGALFWFGVRPLHGLIQQEMDEIQKIDVLREYRSEELARLPELEKQHVLILDRADELDLLPSKDELVVFIRALELLAEESGVAIEIVSQDNTLLESKVTSQPAQSKSSKTDAVAVEGEEPATPAPAAKRKPKAGTSGIIDALPLPHYIRLTITVKAPYQAVTEYLHRVETMPYALEVVGLSIKEASQEDLQELEADALSVPAGAPTQPLSRAALASLTTDINLVIYTRE